MLRGYLSMTVFQNRPLVFIAVNMRLISPITSLRLAVFAIPLLVFSGLISADFTWWDDGGTVHHNQYLNDPGYFWKSIGKDAPMQLYIPVTYTVWSGLAHIAARPHPDA